LSKGRLFYDNKKTVYYSTLTEKEFIILCIRADYSTIAKQGLLWVRGCGVGEGARAWSEGVGEGCACGCG
jgi:hypothetical protein